MSDHRPSYATLAEFCRWLQSAPRGTQLESSALLETLTPIAAASVTPLQSAPAAAPADTWRERLWLVPAETRLGVVEVAEAFDRPRSWVYRHTSEKAAGADRLPHKKFDGAVVFVAGELRAWLADHEETITAGRTVSTLSITSRTAS